VLAGVIVLLACQVAGEFVVRLTGLQVPGAVVGMLIFLLVLRLRKPAADSGLVRAPSVLLKHLQLLFVPAGVGIVVHLAFLRAQAVPIALGLWVSWLLGLVATGWVAALLLRKRA
jgi:putative effector of murein hydrolase LrgA (UPF0299 family)